MSETKVTRQTKRKCRWCGGEYRAPKGEKWKGCPDCAPQLPIVATNEPRSANPVWTDE